MKTQKQIIEDMLEEVDITVKNFKDLVNKNELEPYLDGSDIRGHLVDESHDITPEQVCILGEYVMALSLQENLKLLSQGKSAGKPGLEFSKEPEDKGFTEIILATDTRTGKTTRITGNKLPKGVVDKLRKIVEDYDNE